MKRKIEELRENLDEFVQQDDYPILLVGCVSEELAYVVKFVQSLDEIHEHCYFVTFPEPFESPVAYLDAVVNNVETQIAGANEVRAQEGEPLLPVVPAELNDLRRTPEQRLRGVLDYLRSLLPDASAEDELEHRVVVGLLPLQCSDYKGYCELMHALTTSPQLQPSLERMRVVIYDDRTRRDLVKFLREQKVEHVLTFDVDFSTPALTDALTRDASDPSLPVPERMSCLLQLAALDYSYKRYPDALEKYGLLYQYYEGEDQKSMQAMCLLGTGDTLRAAGHPEQAKARLQQGIALAMEDKAMPVLLNLLLSAWGVCMELRHHEDAESYADSGTKVAAAVLNPFCYADFHEMLGDAQMAQNKLQDGLAAYKRCAELCKTYEYFHRWKSVLERQRKIYEDAHMRTEQREIEHELRVVEAMERSGGAKAEAAT
jgi:tetratricopeptide (TPR) repeat protein